MVFWGEVEEGAFNDRARLARRFGGSSGHTGSFRPLFLLLLRLKVGIPGVVWIAIKVIVTHGDLLDDSGDSIGFSLETGQGTRASLSGNCETFGCFNLRYFPNSFQKIKELIKIVNLVPPTVLPVKIAL